MQPSVIFPTSLRRDVASIREEARRHGQPVEDVGAAVAYDFLDAPDLVALRVDDLPAGLDQEPADRVAVAHTDRPPTSHTGPCVPTGCVSERTRRISNSPVIPSSSQRSRQRAAISGETP